ncbi:VOC family protein [Cellulomonas sp. McL0617]|uniref:VOC family protein n=1 Tax=Cellulomonas sp. McL0617 TaxID=3415675 RepID=UPI003CEC9275
MGIVRPHLWFDDQAEDAATFYVSVVPNTSIRSVVRAPTGTPGVAEGAAFIVELTLDGMPVTFLNGGPVLKLDDAFSFVLECQDQAEIDHYWEALLADGGVESQCGWLKDRFGVSWQVTPTGLDRMMGADADPAGTARAMAALLTMVKLDIATLEAAYAGQ